MPLKQKQNPHLKPLEQAMAARFGWQTNASWRDTLIAAIEVKATKVGMDELAYSRMAIASPGELEVLAGMVTNSETRFFRETDQYEGLKNEAIPELIATRSKERRLDIWSAACSTGEEPYSLAMLLSESLGSELAHWKINLIATDLRGPSIISASQGRYLSSAIQLIDPNLRGKYFLESGSNGRESAFDIHPAIRRMVTFRRANLYDANFWNTMGMRFDLIVCNNLLLYFHALAIRQTVDRLANVIKAGGLLMVMKNETGYIEQAKLRRDPRLPGSFFRKVN
ncbi:MAG TPA: CheR family methyltransferase [Blastocatellia bacterium]|nr:CheR family methyltransferase [Blastocatellia bacterium]